MDQVDILVGQV